MHIFDCTKKRNKKFNRICKKGANASEGKRQIMKYECPAKFVPLA
jgi:hypothetical protein